MDKRDSRQRGGIAQAQNAQENLHISKQQKNYLTNRPKKKSVRIFNSIDDDYRCCVISFVFILCYLKNSFIGFIHVALFSCYFHPLLLLIFLDWFCHICVFLVVVFI